MKKLLILLLILICLSVIVIAPSPNYRYNPYTSKLDYYTTYNGTEFLNASGTFNCVYNQTGSKIMCVNTTAERTEFWDGAEGANDYVTVFHDGSSGRIGTGAGTLWFASGAATLAWDSASLYPGAAGTEFLGYPTQEWKTLYLGEETGSGIYFGLDQDERIYHNNSADSLDFIGDEFRFWDDAEATNDFVSIFHDGTTGRVRSESGDLTLMSGGTRAAIFTAAGVESPVANARNLGATDAEWKTLYLGEDDSSGAYFGLDQNWRLYYNETSEDALIMQNSTGATVMSWEGGRVGIGEVSPGYTLDIYGASSASMNIEANAGHALLYLDSGGAGKDSRLLFRDDGTTKWYMYYDDTDGFLKFTNGTTDHVTFDSSGNVGIGATAPSPSAGTDTTLVIQGSSTPAIRLNDSGQANPWEWMAVGDGMRGRYGATNILTLQDDSTVGIGTVNPAYTLDVNGTIGWGDGANNLGRLSYVSVGGNPAIVAGSGKGLTFYTSGGTVRVMDMETSGDIGLGGQTSPGMALHVGMGSSSHSLTNSENDTFISGMLEVDGTSYFDGSTIFDASSRWNDDKQLIFGTSSDSLLDWSTSQATENTVVWALGDTASSLIFTDKVNRNQDFDHPAQSNPTIFVHSDEDPDNDNTRWGSIAHDNDSFVIDSGSDEIVLDDSTWVSGNHTLGDKDVGEKVLDAYDNGTYFRFDTLNPIYIEKNLSSNSYYGEMWNYTNNATAWNFPIPASGIYYNLTNLTAGSLNGISRTEGIASGGSYLTADIAGTYKIDAAISMEGVGNNNLYAFGIAKNFDITSSRNCYSRRWMALQSVVGSMTVSCILSLDSGDTINLQVENELGTDDIEVHAINVNMLRIGH